MSLHPLDILQQSDFVAVVRAAHRNGSNDAHGEALTLWERLEDRRCWGLPLEHPAEIGCFQMRGGR